MVDTVANCPPNRACFSVGEEHDGTHAAYFVGAAGSNRDVFACGTYVYQDEAGWHDYRWSCHDDALFPAVGQSGTVVLGIGDTSGQCTNVLSSPPNGEVLGCIPSWTSIRLDDGPAYAPRALLSGMWWHVAGRGWIADNWISKCKTDYTCIR
jgi:hypothetical protein